MGIDIDWGSVLDNLLGMDSAQRAPNEGGGGIYDPNDANWQFDPARGWVHTGGGSASTGGYAPSGDNGMGIDWGGFLGNLGSDILGGLLGGSGGSGGSTGGLGTSSGGFMPNITPTITPTSTDSPSGIDWGKLLGGIAGGILSGIFARGNTLPQVPGQVTNTGDINSATGANTGQQGTGQQGTGQQGSGSGSGQQDQTSLLARILSMLPGGLQLVSSLMKGNDINAATDAAAQAATGAAGIQEGAFNQSAGNLSDSLNQALTVMRSGHDTSMNLLSPFISTGTGALQNLSSLINETPEKFSFTPGDLTKEPGYQFVLQEGNKAIERAASAKGGVNSGSTLKELSRFNQGLAETTYQQAFDRAMNTFGLNQGQRQQQISNLGGLVSTGLSSAKDAGQVANQFGSNYSNTLLGGRGAINEANEAAAGAKASGIIGSANVYAKNPLGGATNALGSLSSFLTPANLQTILGAFGVKA